MNFPIKAIIFDFDGLLFDTEPTWEKAYLEFIKVKGIDDVDFGDTTGMGLLDFIDLLKDRGLRGKTDQLVSEYRNIFYKLFGKEGNVLMPGVLEILEKVAKKGLTSAVTSGGHTKQKLEEMFSQHKILKYFSVIISSDDVAHGKPAPDVYLEAVDQLGVEPLTCLAFEDSVNGVMSAVGAGIKIWGVNADEKVRNDLIKAGAAKAYSSLSEVIL